MFNAHYIRHTLQFKRPGGTSRAVLTEKDSWFLFIRRGDLTGIGECSIIRGLSTDNMENYEVVLEQVCRKIENCRQESEVQVLIDDLKDYPSIQFGIETALTDVQTGGQRILFPSEFTASEAVIPINGLIWMGDYAFMEEQIGDKLASGFNCIKLKIGAMDFDREVQIIRRLRENYSSEELIIRVDANGAFSINDCPGKLQQLANLKVHSIEQPIAAGQISEMAKLCASTPLPIALDEELIGLNTFAERKSLMDRIKPQFIILKPSLLGGFKSSEEWIELAASVDAGWWVTSALESNIGLNAIAQWTYTLHNPLHQGLGTGQLYTNNIPSPLKVEHGVLKHGAAVEWDFSLLNPETHGQGNS